MTPDLRPPKSKAKLRFLTVASTLDYEKFNLLKWPFAAIIWSITGLFVSIINTPTTGDTFITFGQSFSVPLAVVFAGFAGISIAWFTFRYNMISVRLYSKYLSRQRQLYRVSGAACGTAQKKLRKSWGDQL